MDRYSVAAAILTLCLIIFLAYVYNRKSNFEPTGYGEYTISPIGTPGYCSASYHGYDGMRYPIENVYVIQKNENSDDYTMSGKKFSILSPILPSCHLDDNGLIICDGEKADKFKFPERRTYDTAKKMFVNAGTGMTVNGKSCARDIKENTIKCGVHAPYAINSNLFEIKSINKL